MAQLSAQTVSIIAAFDAATNDLATGLDEALAFANTKKAEYEAKIAELQAKVEAGDAVRADDLDDLEALGVAMGAGTPRVTEVAARLRGFGASPTEPIPPAPEPLPPIEDPAVVPEPDASPVDPPA